MVFAVKTDPDMLVTTYLEMNSQKDFRPAFIEPADHLYVAPIKGSDVAFYRFLYRSVGSEWCWRDRLSLNDNELRAILEASTTSVHVLYVNHAPAGYVEIARQGESAEIAYFGLRRNFMGRGLGKHLLSYGVEQAWKLGVKRVWLHTCNLDGPHALSNYLKRGFSIYDVVAEPMPDLYKVAA